ncbi:MAG: dTDP-4-dehydrorhamnose reductase [Gemmatimonadaceae bacterium]|nr:dTDP-4-dehydrorhamnose reductase [Gemmatimonadaceae bacterium]
MKVLLFGGTGLLGSALRDSVPSGVTVIAPPRGELDITNENAVAAAVSAARPDWIAVCAAYTAVDRAESEPELARVLNATAVAHVARAAADVGARVLLPSTDYVFQGDPGRPWREDDAPDPHGAYATSKRDGELALEASGAAHVIVRTSWVFGPGRRSFPRAMWERAIRREAARVVADQRGTPTAAVDLANWCWTLMASEARGVLHGSNRGETTWFEVARRAFAHAAFAEGVTPVASADFPTPARRPLYSVLDCSRLDALLAAAGAPPRRSWEDALDEYLATLKPNDS